MLKFKQVVKFSSLQSGGVVETVMKFLALVEIFWKIRKVPAFPTRSVRHLIPKAKNISSHKIAHFGSLN